MEKVLFSLILILSGLSLGYTIRILDSKGQIQLKMPIDDLRETLQKAGILFFMPVSFMAAVWVVNFHDLRIIALPLVGLFALATGGLYGYLLARVLKSSSKQTGALFCCSSFTNIGSIGALICYMFLGEPGFALVALYKIFEEIYYYTVGFPIARYLSANLDNEKSSSGTKPFSVLKDPFVGTILTAFIIGLTLNLTGIPRPPVFETISALFIPTGTFILILSIGLGMRLSRLKKYLPQGVLVTFIKSLLVPAGAMGLAWLTGLSGMENGLVLKVVLILSSMPSAFNALLAASIYELDLDLANSCWLLSTSSLCLLIPWFYWILRYF